MALDDVQVPEPTGSEDLLAAWRGHVRELESLPGEQSDAGGELLTQLRAIADDLACGDTPALLPATVEQAEALSEAIAHAEATRLGDDTLIASPFDFAALTTAIATLEGAASSLLARAEGEFADVRDSVKSEVLAIRETLASELKELREEFQRSHRRAARRSTDTGAKAPVATSEAPMIAKLDDACAQLQALQTQTQRLADALPQPAAPANSEAAAEAAAAGAAEVAEALAGLHQFVESAVVSLRRDLESYAAGIEAQATQARRSADLSATEAEQAIAQIQARIAAAAADADQRLARLTTNVQSTVERAERSASQVEAALAATAALRAEATSAAGNWRDEALRIVRDALARMATETAGAASQAREARKTVVAETRTLRSELLKDAESAHAAVLAEVRRELEQTRAAFAEQRQQLANELSALEEARRQHEQAAAESRSDVSRSVAESASTTRLEVERLDAAYRDLHAHLEEVRAANTRVVAAVQSVEARANAELEPLSAVRQRSEELSEALRAEIGATVAELREARADLEEHHGSVMDSIAEAHTALTAEMVRTVDAAREQLSAAHVDLRRQVEDVGTANDLVVNLAESIEASVRGAIADLDAMRARVGGTDAELRTVCEQLANADQELSMATRRVDASNERLVAAADAIEQRIEVVDRLDGAYHVLHRELDGVRAAKDQVAAAAESLRAQAKAELEPLAELRRQSRDLTIALREQITSVLADVGATRMQAHGTGEDLHAACEHLAQANAGLSIAMHQVDESSERLAAAANSIEQRIEAVDRLDGAYHELHKRLGEVGAANDLLIAAARRIETRASTELEPLTAVRKRSEELVGSLRLEITETLDDLRAAHGLLEEQLRSSIDSIACTQVALTSESEQIASTREQLSAAHGELRKHVDELRAANQVVLEVAERVESSITAGIEPLAELRRESHELTVSLREQVSDVLADLDRTRSQVHGTDQELRAACEQLTRADAALSAAMRRVDVNSDRLGTAADTIEQRIEAVDRLDRAYEQLHRQLDEVRAANERLVAATGSMESQAKAHLEPLAEVRQRSAGLVNALRAEIRDTLTELRETQGALDLQQRSAIDSIAATQSALTLETQQVASTREQLADAHDDLRRQLDEVRAANELVIAAAGSVESRVTAELQPLADLRRRSEELTDTFGTLIVTLPQALHAKVDVAIAELSSATVHVAEAEERINAAAESTQDRVHQEIDALAKARSEYETAIERLRADTTAHVSRLAHDLRNAVEQQMRAASHEIRAELEVVVNALRDQVDRATIAEREVAVLRDASESKQEGEDGAALRRAVGMLSVLESLDDALHALQSEQSPEARSRIDHFERQARAMAELVELQEIRTDGEVDEDRHEIVGIDAKLGELGRIIDVRQRGYAFRGRVVRRAQVVVGGVSTGAVHAHTAAELRS